MAIQPMQQPKGNSRLVKTVGAGAAATLLLFVSAWEGKSNDPYKDIVGVWTVCYGETRVQMRRYSDAECKAMKADALVDFAEPVLKRNPELRGRDNQLAAAVSLAYNIGSAGYNRSTVARRFSQGRWREACDAFLLWNRAGGKVVRGLDNRRRAERALCLRGLPA
jgi:lysozyme